MATLGEKLRKLREGKGLSQRELEKETGISDSYISELENNNKANPSMEKLKKLANFFNVDLSYFVASEKSLKSLSPEQRDFFEELLSDEKRKTILRESRDMSEEDLIRVIQIMKAFKEENE